MENNSVNPAISVVMPVYNVEKYIANSIQSILEQTYEKFELIIIDDASTDRTFDIIQDFKDNRIVKIRNKSNIGIANSLNKGINVSKADFVARMDGDDISMQDRFEKQLRFMKDSPKILASGTYMQLLREDGTAFKLQEKPLGKEKIKISLFFGYTSMSHPSLIIRKSLLNRYHLRYDSAFQYAEDYDLYCRCIQYAPLDNLPEALVQYRIHNNSVSQKFYAQQKNDARAALYLHLRRLKLPFTLDEFTIHTNISYPEDNCLLTVKEIISWFDYLRAWNRKHKYFEINLFEEQCTLHQKKLLREKNLL